MRRPQFVTRFDDPTATNFFGQRAVFAELEQHTAVAGHAAELDLHAHPDTGAVRAALRGHGRLPRLQGVRPAPVHRDAVVHGGGSRGGGRRPGGAATRWTRTAIRRWTRLHASATPTSTSARCAETRCCAGSTGPAPRSSSSGSRTAAAASRSATLTWPRHRRRLRRAPDNVFVIKVELLVGR